MPRCIEHEWGSNLILDVNMCLIYLHLPSGQMKYGNTVIVKIHTANSFLVKKTVISRMLFVFF